MSDSDDEVWFEGCPKMGDFKRKHEAITGEPLEDKKVRYYYNIYKLHNFVSLKEIADHPYLVHHPVDKQGFLISDQELIKASGKMLVLNKLLPRLKQRGHRVLIFSTLVIMLNVLECYMEDKNYKYSRLDGRDDLETREYNINKFNKEKDTFVFLISTRAGGLGLNLTSADTVIMFDRDWVSIPFSLFLINK